jgi:hypothetical protein
MCCLALCGPIPIYKSCRFRTLLSMTCGEVVDVACSGLVLLAAKVERLRITDISRSSFRFCPAAGRGKISSEDKNHAILPFIGALSIPIKSDSLPSLFLLRPITQCAPFIGLTATLYPA